jgi:hypothetical protein
LGSGPLVTWEDIQPPSPYVGALTRQLELVGSEVSARAAQPGDTLLLKLYWHTLSPVSEEYVLLLRLYDEQGRVVDEALGGPDVLGAVVTGGSGRGGQAYQPANVQYPTSQWRADEIVLGQYAYRVPVEAAPGQGELRATLLLCRGGLVTGSWPPTEQESPGEETVIAFQAPSGAESEAAICRASEVGAEVAVALVEIEATERIFSTPEVQHRVEDGNLGGRVALYGYDLSAEVVRPGDTLYLALFWQALEAMDTPYTVFTHLLDEDNQVRGQMDSQPLGGTRPTTGWIPQEYLRDDYQLVVQPDAPPGDYLIEVGMYDASTPDFQRLLRLDGEGRVVDNRIVVDTVIRVER